MIIKLYSQSDELALFRLIENEGAEWIEYFGEKGRDQYKKALEKSITYVLYEDDVLCGYCRCREDGGFGVYIYDLLVDKKYRGKKFGHSLMKRVCFDFPEEPVYVMSDVDQYYEKQGYRREGSIFEVIP